MDAPFVSIIIPTLDRPGFVRQTLSCIQQQTYANYEVIVVDQSAADHNTGDWPRVSGLQHVRMPRQNLPEARNLGMQIARGGLVLFLDDDVVFDSLLVAAHVRAHAAKPEAGAVTGRIRLAPPHFYPAQNAYAVLNMKSGAYSANYDLDSAGFVTCMSGGNVSLKQEAVLAAGPFDTAYKGNAFYEEIDFSLRLFRKGFDIWYEPAACLTHFRADHGGCRTQTGPGYLRNKFRNTGYFFTKNLSLFPGLPFFTALKNEIEFYTRKNGGGHRVAEALLHGAWACLGLARGACKRITGL